MSTTSPINNIDIVSMNEIHRGGARKKTKDPNCKTLSVIDAGARYFGLGVSASYAAARRGDLPTIKIGKSLRVPIVALERMLQEARPTRKDDDEHLIKGLVR
jgi:Helix-turn-helix domain